MTVALTLSTAARELAPGKKLFDADVKVLDRAAAELTALWAARKPASAKDGGSGLQAADDAFSRALPLILAHEGGYVNDPQDPGGATNKGVTQATYDGWRAKQGLPAQSVRQITADEVAAIYRRDYWDKVRGDDLPAGVGYAVFDFAVNSGPARAARFLQKVVSVPEDGVIGPATLAAVNSVAAVSAEPIIDRLCDARLAFLRSLPTFARFGTGWSRRVSEVRAKAKEWAR